MAVHICSPHTFELDRFQLGGSVKGRIGSFQELLALIFRVLNKLLKAHLSGSQCMYNIHKSNLRSLVPLL